MTTAGFHFLCHSCEDNVIPEDNLGNARKEEPSAPTEGKETNENALSAPTDLPKSARVVSNN